MSARLSVLLLSSLLLLTGCSVSSPKSPSLSVENKAENSVEGSVITDIAPGENLPGSSAVTDTEAPVVTTISPGESEEPSSGPDHHEEEGTGKLPEGITIPESATVFEPGQRIDGYSSSYTLLFDTPWESSAKEVRELFEKAGWKCKFCLPYAAEPGSKAIPNARYVMSLTRDGHEVFILVNTGGVSSSADISFQG